MTAQILSAELGILIQDSKRKNTELRNAAEKSLQDLKSLPNTSDAQLAADLSRRPHFVSPFLIACGTRNTKSAATGISCLQRLSVARALPRERLNEILEAFRESVSSTHDVQLKILQALPSLLQNFPSDVRGDLLSNVLQICSGLLNAKNPAVSNTAAATLQQLVMTVFDRVAAEDERALEIPIVTEVKGDDGLVPVRPAANDAYKLSNDLLLLLNGEKPLYMRLSSLPPASILELLEAILSNHGTILTDHVEQVHIVRTLLMPLIIRSLSDRLSFPVTLRVIRIFNLVIRTHLDILPSECEIALGLLNHMLDPEASQLWKRALCLEFFRGIYADPQLLLSIYNLFDAAEGKKAIFGDNLASFVRLAVEKPALIGLGQQSSVPAQLGETSEQGVAEAGAIAGLIGTTTPESNSNARPIGISSQWSSLKTSCMEHLDKTEPPSLPDTYVYSLVLTCITNISESLAKFVLPLTVHQENKSRRRKKEDSPEPETDLAPPESTTGRFSRTQSFRKKTVPVNPLDLTDHVAYLYIQTSSTLVVECWPAVLATCSTFLNAALDADYYRALIRAIQKFTHVAGLLRLPTPRDAFLTTLGKAAVPANLIVTSVASSRLGTGEKNTMFQNAKALLSVDSLASQSSAASIEKNRQPSHDSYLPTLGARNLLCLRALLNLAIALGPTLQSAWSIIFETLQIADLVMSLTHQSNRAPSGFHNRTDPDATVDKLDAETSAVQAAARRLFESTVDYPNESFTDVLRSLCALLSAGSAADDAQKTPTTTSRPQVLHQRRLGSVSGISLNTDGNSRDAAFALNKIGELAALNEARLSQYEPIESGWDIFIAEVVRFSADSHHATSTRLLAADILARTVREMAEFSMSDEHREDIQARILSALQKQISGLYPDPTDAETSNDTDIRVHQIALEALKSVIEQCGESLVAGWGAVFESLMSVFLHTNINTMKAVSGTSKREQFSVRVVSKSLARSAFATMQLVCSDFMSAVPDASLATLLELLLRFSRQQEDLNMSLTAITFYWNVSDFLQPRNDLSSLLGLLDKVEDIEHVRTTLLSHSQDGLIPALWLRLLLNLSSITTDERTEVRNSATQTVQRIFESYSEQSSSEVWMLCLRVILFDMVEANISTQQRLRTNAYESKDVAGWNETTKTILDTVSVLYTAYMDKLDSEQLGDAWSELTSYLQQYFDCNSHTLGLSIFETIGSVLSHVHGVKAIGLSPVLKTADIWTAYFDHSDAWSSGKEGNQDAFVSYADAFKPIYRLAERSLDSRLPLMLVNLERCIVESDEVAYSSDLDHMTSLQTRVIECLATVETRDSNLPSCLLRLLSRLAILPYTALAKDGQKRGPTFVALAKSAMKLLEDTAIKHIGQKDIYVDKSILFTLQSLTKPIQEKYVWKREGKTPTMWEKATTTAITILRAALPMLNAWEGDSLLLQQSWATIIELSYNVTRAHMSPVEDIPASLERDEDLDIAAYTELKDLITLPLGSPAISDALRRSYTRNLFTISLIHKPLPGELPDLIKAPLDGLYKIRYGQTADLDVALRTKMSYACMTELFNLVSKHDDGTGRRIKLAQAAAPYVILRAALPLKTYIADQPIRGRMPTPEAERRELLFVLKALGHLRSEPQAIPDAPGVRSKHHKHLHRLYPLLNKASRVAKQDGEMFEHVMRLMDLVGDEFGLDNE
ncbi:Endocytosis and vacuole integrity protein [Pleosporales sp. CAS-2024a]